MQRFASGALAALERHKERSDSAARSPGAPWSLHVAAVASSCASLLRYASDPIRASPALRYTSTGRQESPATQRREPTPEGLITLTDLVRQPYLSDREESLAILCIVDETPWP